MKHRIISVITALVFCLSLCPAWAFAVEGDGETPADAAAKVETNGQM